MTVLWNIMPIVVISGLFLIGILLSWKLPPCSGQPGTGKVCLYCDCPRISELYQKVEEKHAASK